MRQSGDTEDRQFTGVISHYSTDGYMECDRVRQSTTEWAITEGRGVYWRGVFDASTCLEARGTLSTNHGASGLLRATVAWSGETKLYALRST